jgi:ATP-dependent protease ClpP protease subunit
MKTKLTLRPVGDDGLLTDAIGSATLAGKKITYDGSPILADVIAAIAQRFRIDEATAFARLADDGWSNGKMVISADAGVGQEEGTMGARVDLTRLHNLTETARARLAPPPERIAAARAAAAGRCWYRIENAAPARADEPASVYLYDMIGDWGITAQDFVRDLSQVKASAIDLHVSCEGGEVFDGTAIYESLRQHPANITAYVDGIAASSASFVVQAANKIVMAPRARMMIHDAHGVVMGNARDMAEMATLLDSLSDTIADIYAERAGGTRAQWRAAMRAAEGGPDGTWYDAEAAVRAGLADEVQGGAPAGRAPARAELRDETMLAAFSPSALLAVFSEVENPPEVIEIPHGQALLEMFKTP